jgi:purine-binding chemotaxis protein CheW
MTEQIDLHHQPSTAKTYLTFSLGDEMYGIDILKVQELKSGIKVTALPMTPGYVSGLLNMRGEIAPIIDLRQRLGMVKKEVDMNTIVILLAVSEREQQRPRIVGIVVDAVSESREIAQQSIKAAPDFGEQRPASYIKGIAEIDDKVMTILDSDILLSLEALA